MSPYWMMMGIILILTPVICWLFTLSHREMRTPLSQVGELIHQQRFYLHIMGYIVIIVWKRITDNLNEPIKQFTGQWTDLVYAIEGDSALWVQQTFESASLTAFLNFHYLFIYLFLIYVTTVYYAYTGERDMTDKVTLNYLLIYAIAVPYYLFFNVEVTSSWIPGMKALLYHDGFYTTFYVSHDPLDNAVPSLHIAIPFGILLLNWMHCRERGIKMKDWAHYRYHLFILANTVLFMFTILYLGIHWFVDIPLGMIVGTIGALFIHQIQPRLRNDYGGLFKGISPRRLRAHLLVEGGITIALVLVLMSVPLLHRDLHADQPSYRIGSGETDMEIIQQIDYYETVDVYVTNMDDYHNLAVVVIDSEYSVQYMTDGTVDWEQLKQSQFAIKYLEYGASRMDDAVFNISPGNTAKITVSNPKVWHLVFMHHDAGADSPMEVQVINDYHQSEAYLTKAYLLSIPSLWITAWVLHRLWRMKQNGVHWLTSAPSHTWPNDGSPHSSESE